MILPYFDYGDIIYYNLSNKMSDKLQKLQIIIRALKICTTPQMNIPLALLYRSTNTVPLEKRRLAHAYNFMYKQKVNVHKLDVRRIFTRRRDAPIFHIKRPFCEKYKMNVFYYGANLWNELPVETRKIETVVLLTVINFIFCYEIPFKTNIV